MRCLLSAAVYCGGMCTVANAMQHNGAHRTTIRTRPPTTSTAHQRSNCPTQDLLSAIQTPPAPRLEPWDQTVKCVYRATASMRCASAWSQWVS
eukprot:15484576-Alexandrium_andersonii.AAC.1